MCQASRPCEPEKIGIICMPVAAVPDPVPGSTQVPCLQCGTACWIAPETAARQATEPDAVFEHYCIGCAAQEGAPIPASLRRAIKHEEN